MESFHLSRAFYPALRPLRAGFTLIEMLVVTGIIMAITSLALVSQSSFNKTLILANTAYDVGLTLRSAETFGLQSRVLASTARTGYGVNFQSATPGTFTLFADLYPGPSASPGCHQASDPSAPDARPGNCVYDADQNERVTDYALGNNITITNFCAYAAGAWSCATTNGSSLTSLDIVFARPNPQAFMSTNGAYSVPFPITQACLTVSASAGASRHVSVNQSGAITANAASCP